MIVLRVFRQEVRNEHRGDVPESMGLQKAPEISRWVESGISWIKRCFRLRRCIWKACYILDRPCVSKQKAILILA